MLGTGYPKTLLSLSSASGPAPHSWFPSGFHLSGCCSAGPIGEQEQRGFPEDCVRQCVSPASGTTLMARGRGGKGLFPFLAPSPGVGAKQEGAPPQNPSAGGVQRPSSCLTMLGWAGVSLGGHGTLSGCSVSLAEPGCPPVCPAPPPPFLGSQRLWAEGCTAPASAPGLAWTAPAMVPSISHPCHMSCPSAAAWLPGLPAGCPGSLPSLERLTLGEEPAGPGGRGAAGRGC